VARAGTRALHVDAFLRAFVVTSLPRRNDLYNGHASEVSLRADVTAADATSSRIRARMQTFAAAMFQRIRLYYAMLISLFIHEYVRNCIHKLMPVEKSVALHLRP
jgi:hypothetical protein